MTDSENEDVSVKKKVNSNEYYNLQAEWEHEYDKSAHNRETGVCGTEQLKKHVCNKLVMHLSILHIDKGINRLRNSINNYNNQIYVLIVFLETLF